MTQRFRISDLEMMDVKLGSSRDVPLSLVEGMRLWFNRHLVDGGVGSGDGYNCKDCGSNDMEYFKREYELKNSSWNPEKTKHVVVPPIGRAIELPDKIFYLTGQCKRCSHEQRVSDRLNRVTYWYSPSI